MPPSEPLWYCHECHAEMRPLMAPDPICASCHGGFIERMENPQDDPRAFANADDDPFNGGGPPLEFDTFLMGLQSLMERGMGGRAASQNRGPQPAQGSPTSVVQTSRLSFQISSPGGGTRTVSFGGPNTLNGPPRRNSADNIPTASEYVVNEILLHDILHRISRQLMAHYLFRLLGDRDPFSAILAGGLGGPEGGRMGDYVFDQEALDQVITQLMENSNAHRPVPATEEIMNKLPREILMQGSATLEKDCAVCKEQFDYEAEDPDERIVVSLPCKHPFHEPCIMPWLKSSGTCPVCRYALVPQPTNEHGPQPSPGSPSTSSNALRNSPPQPRPSSPSSPNSRGERENSGGFIQNLLGAFTGHHHNHHQNPQPPAASSTSRNSPPHRSNIRGSGQHENLPGGWADDLD
ncbi:hypothetical protein FA13DRAFT_1751395 [Coprinellus micaceus]|uniref:RING-type domain-containing protein n=1 Tax=Coprinellus micaceus TaxID=71717 RepID=A0A4Y7TXB9_COPMI|nr:hypothetical protein FA13DRAFT_1751395 [Coprinellus micaceus]